MTVHTIAVFRKDGAIIDFIWDAELPMVGDCIRLPEDMDGVVTGRKFQPILQDGMLESLRVVIELTPEPSQ